MVASVYWFLCVLCTFIVWYQIRVLAKGSTKDKASCLWQQWSDALLHKTHHKVLVVLWYQGFVCRSTMSSTKIIHQIWRNHQFSQRNKATKRVSGGWWGWTKSEKEEVGNIGRLRTLWQKNYLWPFITYDLLMDTRC